MSRGRLRVFLGAAPGVGKTYAMLEEGQRLAALGGDVVVAWVDTHGRAATAAMASPLEQIPRRTTSHRGVELSEMDLDAVLARHPDVALVDELAHSNAPGSAHEKRWQDVEALLDAGIDVMSTVNIQHIASLNDVVEKITKVPQRETVPDEVLRAADQIELVDLTPQALRNRLSDGHVYPAERIDAALSHYFRLGNLTALRELALLWLADEVDSALQNYRAQHNIDGTWEARERVVVALTGGAEGETLLRRGARIASRSSGGDLLAVHVSSPDGLSATNQQNLATQRALVEELGGSFHEIVGQDIPASLISFAKGVNATQLVIGVSRRSWLQTVLTGPGIGNGVVRQSGSIDVHIVTHAEAGRRFALPSVSGGLTARRRTIGFALALVLGPLLTLLLKTIRSDDAMTANVLAYQLLVIVIALVGGFGPAVFAALMSGLTLDYFFISPYYTITINQPLHALGLGLYVINALLVSYVVDQAARRTRLAQRSGAESELLASIAGSVLRGQDALAALLSRTREAFGFNGVRIVSEGTEVAHDGTPSGEPSVQLPVGPSAGLEAFGPAVDASERRLLEVIATQIAAALEHTALEETAATVGPLAVSDKVRSALLSAVSHDLRRPLAAAMASVGALRSMPEDLSAQDRAELLTTADESLQTLSSLVTDLLDASRLDAGILAVAARPVSAAEVVLPALDELGLGPSSVTLDLPTSVPPMQADPVLLQRVLVNLLANATRFNPPGTPIRLSASSLDDVVELRVVDHGPGVPDDRKELIFTPFQRLGDTDNDRGIGLGLALSKGFTEGMSGTLTAEDTPGGGLTMVVSLPTAPALVSA